MGNLKKEQEQGLSRGNSPTRKIQRQIPTHRPLFGVGMQRISTQSPPLPGHQVLPAVAPVVNTPDIPDSVRWHPVDDRTKGGVRLCHRPDPRDVEHWLYCTLIAAGSLSHTAAGLTICSSSNGPTNRGASILQSTCSGKSFEDILTRCPWVVAWSWVPAPVHPLL